MSTWWKNASEDERMAQVEGGIECQMTAGQIAVASRCTRGEILAFGDANGLVFRGRPALGKPKPARPPVFDIARRPAPSEFKIDDALSAWTDE